MRVVVTGGSGQLGSRVLRRLAQDRRVKAITSVDLHPPAVASPKIRAVSCDVRDPQIARHFSDRDALVHLAFVVTEARPRAEVDAINVGGSRNVFEAAARAGLSRIVYSSSIAAYGVVPGHPEPITEETRRVHQPSFAYAATKFEVEALLDDFERDHADIGIVRFRPAVLIGHDMDHALGRALRRGRLVDAGDQPLPVVWDEDVADAIALALFSNERGAFNVASDGGLSPRELAALGGLRVLRLPRTGLRAAATAALWLSRMGLGRAMDPAWLDTDGARMIISSERAKRVLGWRPRCPTAADVMARYQNEVPRQLDRRIALFFRVVEEASKRRPPDPTPGSNLIFHLRLTGRDGGDFAVAFQDGRVRASRGVPRPPDAALFLATDAFREMLAGPLDMTTAQWIGKVQLDGNPAAAMVLGGIMASFRALRAEPGWRGRFAGRLVDSLSTSHPRGPANVRQSAP